MTDFNQFNLPAALNATLAKMEFTTPTPIQKQAIPLGLQGRDILGTAQTGTGKTAAFAIPMIVKLMESTRGTAMVLTPTRELAVQVLKVVNQILGANNPIRTALLIGGESMPAQLQQLRARPRIFVGTPGRINDHLARGSLMLHDTGILVLDETDRMLDMGFGVQLEQIVKFMPAQRQTLMFSATLPPEIVKFSAKYLKNPERITVGEVNKAAIQIKQEIIHTTPAKKYDDLLNELNKREGSIIVFVKTKHGAGKLAEKLTKVGHSADAIHGDLMQRKRDRVINGFREKRFRILVATDIAARGLDIPHIEHVINHDLPQCPEDFIHRIGRTARAGAEGSALSLITAEDGDKWRAINRLINPGSAEANAPSNGAGRNYASKGKPNRFSRNRNGSGSGNSGGRSGERRPEGGRPEGARKPNGGGNNRPRFAKAAS